MPPLFFAKGKGGSCFSWIGGGGGMLVMLVFLCFFLIPVCPHPVTPLGLLSTDLTHDMGACSGEL